jgi:Ca2+-transporting ATPase
MSGGGYVLASKGAPEAIADVCHMDATTRANVVAVADRMASQGLRVLGVASCRRESVPGDPLDESYRFHGLLGFLDPVRKDVPAALAEARQAGIKVAMITGDYPATALKIAADAGIDIGGVLTGPELQRLDAAALGMKVRDIRVFARIQPEQKLRLVEAFKQNGEVVAMTGDGINDAPALEAAHIGIAMGQRGTDVAREAADIVLLDDSFGSIIGGVSLGRRIFANLRKALVYVTAVHMPTAILAVAPIVLGLPPILLPMHIVLIEMVIDPVCSIVFEAEPSEKNAMRRPPRSIGEGLFGRREIALAILQGVVIAAVSLGMYLAALRLDLPATEARALAFIAVVTANLILAFADSAEVGSSFFDRRRIAFWSITASTVAILGLIFFVPALSDVFAVVRPQPLAVAASLVLALAAGGWFGMLRRLGAFRR